MSKRLFILTLAALLIAAACGREKETTAGATATSAPSSGTTAANAGQPGPRPGRLRRSRCRLLPRARRRGERGRHGSGRHRGLVAGVDVLGPGLLGPPGPQPRAVRHRRGVHEVVQRARRHPRPPDRPAGARREAHGVPAAHHRGLRPRRLLHRRRRRGVRRHRPEGPPRVRAPGDPRLRGHAGRDRSRPLDPTGADSQQREPVGAVPVPVRPLPRDQGRGGRLRGLDRHDQARRGAQQGSARHAGCEGRVRRHVQPGR